VSAPVAPSPVATAPAAPPPTGGTPFVFAPDTFRAKLSDEIRKRKRLLHGVAVAQARRIDIDDRSITFVFSAIHKASVVQVEQNLAFLDALVVELAGRPMAIRTEILKDDGADGGPIDEMREQLKARALAENAVQGLLDVFPGEIRDVQEIK
jgi:hypothetical protein